MTHQPAEQAYALTAWTSDQVDAQPAAWDLQRALRSAEGAAVTRTSRSKAGMRTAASSHAKGLTFPAV